MTPKTGEIDRADELEPRGEAGAAFGAGDHDLAVLDRRPERLESRPLELRQLVQEQDAAMGERRLAGPRPAAAADDRDRGGAVVRRPERGRGDERVPRVE